jgi:hypothetical protein
MERADYRLAESKWKAAKSLEWSLLQEHPDFWRAWFNHLCEAVLKTENAAQARVPIDQGKAANNNIQALAQACIDLTRLLPSEQQSALPDVIRSHVF